MNRIAILLVVVSTAFAACPHGWLQFNTHCYALGKGHVGFNLARDACESIGARLVEINNPEEGHFVTENVMKDADAWIGVTGEKGEWTLLSGVPVKYTNWVPSHKRPQSQSRMCVTSLQNNFGRWAETLCEKEHRFVCEMNTPVTAEDESQEAEKILPFWTSPWLHSGYFPRFMSVGVPVYGLFSFPDYWPFIEEPSDEDSSNDADHPRVDKKEEDNEGKPTKPTKPTKPAKQAKQLKVVKLVNEVGDTRQRREVASGDGSVFLSGSQSSGNCVYGGCNSPSRPSYPSYPSYSNYPSYPSYPGYSNYPSYPIYSRYPSYGYPSYGYPSYSSYPYYSAYNPYYPSYQPYSQTYPY